MLQLPESGQRPASRLSQSTERSRSRSPLDEAIEQHKSASRLLRLRENELEGLMVANPSLRDTLRPHFQLYPDQYREFTRLSRKAGIPAAETRRHAAVMLQKAMFQKLINAIPQSSKEVARYARYLVLAVRNDVGGNFYPHIGMQEVDARGGLEACHEREQAAFVHLEAAFRALAKRRRLT